MPWTEISQSPQIARRSRTSTRRAREVISRICRSFLDHLFITPTELLHHREYQKRFSLAGNALETAVQKAALAQVRDTPRSVTDRIKELHVLLDDFPGLLRKAARGAGELEITEETYVETVRAVIDKSAVPDRDARVFYLLSLHMEGCDSWAAKIERLLALVSDGLAADEQRYIDVIVGECLRSKVAVDTLFGGYELLQDRLDQVVDLHDARYALQPEAKPVLARLNEVMREGEWPTVQAALGANLHGILATWTPLVSSDFMHELRAIGIIYRRVGEGTRVIGGARTIELIERRLSRTLSIENITERLYEFPSKSQQISLLLDLESIVVGKHNQTMVENYIDYIFGDPKIGERILAEQDSDERRLVGVASLRAAFLRSSLRDIAKDKYTRVLGDLHESYLERIDFFGRLDSEASPAPEKARRLMTLFAEGGFLGGANLEAARNLLRGYIREPGFLEGYLDGAEGDRQRKARLRELQQNLKTAGIQG